MFVKSKPGFIGVLFLIGALYLVVMMAAFAAVPVFAADQPASEVLTIVLSDLPWYGKAFAVYGVVSAVIGVFAQIAAVTPTPKDDKLAAKLVKLVNFLGANFFQAKNKR